MDQRFGLLTTTVCSTVLVASFATFSVVVTGLLTACPSVSIIIVLTVTFELSKDSFSITD